MRLGLCYSSFGRRSSRAPAIASRGAVSRTKVFAFVSRLQDLETTHQCLINGHHRARIVEFAAVIRSTEQRDELATLEKLVSIFDDLMGTADKIKIMLFGEVTDYPLTECETDTAIIISEPVDTALWIRPKEIAK